MSPRDDVFGRPMQPQRIAVVGSGAAGLAAAWALSKFHQVDLIEQAGRLGGHANTVEIDYAGIPVAVDTGFIVYNTHNYPNLTGLFDALKVETEASEMSFAVSLDGGRMEYAGRTSGLVAQPSNWLKPRYLSMLRDLFRFYGNAASSDAGDLTLGEFLERNGYGTAFVEDHLLPMGAAIWSGNPGDVMSQPAYFFLRFFENHALLKFRGRPQWRTVTGGSRRYVEKIERSVSGDIRVGIPVTAILRRDDHAEIADAAGRIATYDHIVIATHADQALSLLSDATVDERRALGAFQYQPNRAVLHRDPSLMPKRRAVWSSWNYIGRSDATADAGVAVTYWMNRLQNIDQNMPLFVSLNPDTPPRDDLVFGTFDYTHPQFGPDTLAAQRRVRSLQGRQRTWFCGSYCGYGFHEDAVASGLDVAAALGAPAAWQTTSAPQAALLAS